MEQSGDFIVFLGRFHPLFLHLPIGFLVLAVLLELASRTEKYVSLKPAVGFSLLLGALSALVAAILGLMLAQDGGYSEDLLSIHKWLGIALVVFSFGAWILYVQKEKKQTATLKKAYIGSLAIMMAFLGGAGHYGGSLTHGTTYLTQNMPNGLRKLVGMPVQEGPKLITNLNEAEVFSDIIHPILEMRCNSCHNASKKKGELQMHTAEALKKGGENGDVFVAGDATKSMMIQRVHLPEVDEEHMPPKGKTQLTPEQIALLEWWIGEGAPFDKKVQEVAIAADIDEILQTLVDPNANKTEVEILLAEDTTPVDGEKLNDFKSKGVMIKALSNNSNWLQVTIDKNLPVADLLSELSLAFPDQVTWLDLKETPITDAALAPISSFKHLTRLRLEKTAITDEAMSHLQGLNYLEFLNIYGSNVSDEGIEKLSDLRNLRRLYAWESGVSAEGAKKLEEKMGQLEVNLGFEVQVIDSLTVQVIPVGLKE